MTSKNQKPSTEIEGIRRENAELHDRRQQRLLALEAEFPRLVIDEARSKWEAGKLADEELAAYVKEERQRPRLDKKAKSLADFDHEKVRLVDIARIAHRDVRTVNNWRYFYRMLPDFGQYDRRLSYMHYVHLYELRNTFAPAKQTELLTGAAENLWSTRAFKAQLAQAADPKKPSVSPNNAAATAPPAVADGPSIEPNPSEELAQTIKDAARQLERLLVEAIDSPGLTMMFRTEDLNELIHVKELITTMVDRVGIELGAHVLEAACA